MRDDAALYQANNAGHEQGSRKSSLSPQSRGEEVGGSRASYRLAWLLALLATLTLEVAAADRAWPFRQHRIR